MKKVYQLLDDLSDRLHLVQPPSICNEMTRILIDIVDELKKIDAEFDAENKELFFTLKEAVNKSDSYLFIHDRPIDEVDDHVVMGTQVLGVASDATLKKWMYVLMNELKKNKEQDDD